MAPALPAIYTATGDVTCTAGSEVTCITTTSALASERGMNYYPLIQGVMVFKMGATASASLVIAARYSGGADFTTQTVDVGLLANNATIAIPVLLVGANVRSNTSGQINANAIEVTALAGTTACTFNHLSSYLLIALCLGPDA